ncbi:MAG: TetR family transcriptional regulator [Acidovorax sp.]
MARRTKADAQTTRNNLLDAAEQLFQSRGVSHTSLNDIAVAAGTTRGPSIGISRTRPTCSTPCSSA